MSKRTSGELQHFASRVSVGFPLTKRGDVIVSSPPERPGLRPEEALSRLEAALEDERPSELERHGLELRFRVNMFRFVGKSNLLNPVDRGSFVVSEMPDGLRVSYDLSLRRMFVVATCLAILLGAFLVGVASPKPQGRGVLAGLLYVWGGLFGVNYLISAVRFPRFIRRVLAGDY